jgi:hypothetical protein
MVVPTSMVRFSPHVSWFLLNLARFLTPRFLVSAKPRPFLGFFKTSPVFLVSSKSRPTNVVVTRWFSPDLSVCRFP